MIGQFTLSEDAVWIDGTACDDFHRSPWVFHLERVAAYCDWHLLRGRL